MRQRDEQVGPLLAQDGADAPLVLGIDVGVQQAHRDRLAAERVDLADRRVDGGLVERLEHLAARQHALADFQGQVAVDQRLRPVEEEIEGFDAVGAADGVDVAETGGGQQRGAGALALQHGVDGDGRAMQDFVDDGGLAVGELDAGGDAAGRVRRNRRCFRGHDLAVDIADQVGERASDIHADNVHVVFLPPSISSREMRCAR